MEQPIERSVTFYDGAKVTGLSMKLDGWRYPIVINTETGVVSMDNYNGRWGRFEHLEALYQAYSVEAAKQAGLDSGLYSHIEEQLLPNGDIELTCYEAF